MSHNTLLEEVHISKINLQDEVKSKDNDNLELQEATIKIYETDRLQNSRGTEVNDKYIEESINKTLDTHAKKKHVNYGNVGGPQERAMPMFWVQYNLSGGQHIPPGGAPPLVYDPSRNYFIRIVFSILLFMLTMTALFGIFVRYTDARHLFLRFNLIFAIGGLIGVICINYAMSCSACTRTPPCNIICLFLAVCFMSVVVAAVIVRYRTDILLLALATTAGVVLLCLGLAYTKFDFTRLILYVIVIGFAISLLGLSVFIYSMVTKTSLKPVVLAILIASTLINVIMIIIELQMVIGGRSVELSEDDYALAAFMLYNSIVNLFLHLVRILGLLDELL